MAICEHFIYTTGIVNNQRGYQVTSKSFGISNQIISELDNYLYPLGVNLSEFLISKSLLILKENIVYIKVRNIGMGFDGRPDTLYSHIIIMKKKDFKKFNYDSRIFDDIYIEKFQSSHITPILIKEKKLLPDFTCVDQLGISLIEKIFIGILNKKKILLADIDSLKLIQSILSLLPSSMRIISYSTNVAEPNRQSKYDIIQIKKNNIVKFSDSVIIDKKISSEKTEKNDTLLNFCIKYILNIINLKETKKLEKINYQIESISNNIYKKIILGTSLSIMSEDPYEFPKPHIHRLEEILQKTSDKQNETIHELNCKFNEFLDKQKSGEFEIEHIISKFNNRELNITTLGQIFGELTTDNKNLRNYLFHQLVKKRIYDFEKNGQEILLKSINRYYNNEIIQGYVEEPKLHFAFKNIFVNNEINEYQKINLFSMALKNALCYNIKFLENLFGFNVHDLKNNDHILQLTKDINWIFLSKEFHQNLSPNEILKILMIIHKKIISLFPENNKSEIINSKFYNMEGILNMLLNITRYMLTRKKHSLGSSINNIIIFENTLSEFLAQNSSRNTKYDNLFNSDLSNKIPSVCVWMLFLRLSYRCNNNTDANIKK